MTDEAICMENGSANLGLSLGRTAIGCFQSTDCLYICASAVITLMELGRLPY